MCKFVFASMSACVGRTPVLATSVQEQLETGSKSTEEVVDEASQVRTCHRCLFSATVVRSATYLSL